VFGGAERKWWSRASEATTFLYKIRENAVVRRTSPVVRIWIRLLSIVAFAALTLPFVRAAASAAPVAVITVYPLVGVQGAPDTIGVAVANSLIAGLTQRGDVQASLAPANAVQADYLKTARAAGADYYVAGRVSAIGNQVSAIEQIVVTKSGVVVWQNSQMYVTPDDAVASGTAMRDAIVALSKPQYAPLSAAAPPPQPVATAAPKTAPTRPPAPLPIPPASYGGDAAPGNATIASTTGTFDPTLDGPRIAIVDVGGSAMDAVKHYLPTSILRTLPKYHMSGVRADIDTSDIQADGIAVCAQTGADVIMGGTLESFMDGDPGMGLTMGTHLTLDIYACRNLATKPLVIDIHTSNGNAQTSIDIAVDQALKQYAGTLKTAAR
jgi:TolB-like protein